MFSSRFILLASVASALVIASQAIAAPVIVGSYWDETASGTCGGASLCPAFFSQVPANKRLVVRRISCNIQTQYQPRRAVLQLSTTPNAGDTLPRVMPLPIPYAPPVSPGSVYYTGASLETSWLIGEGRFPYLLVEQNQPGTAGVTCTMIGDLVDPS